MKIIKKFMIIFFLTNFVGCMSSGSAIITGNVRPTIKLTEVKIYLEPPLEYETIGLVEASSDVYLSAQAAQDRVIEVLKEKAAKIGANGVLLNNTDTKTGMVGAGYGGSYGLSYLSSYDTKTARGHAIFVIQE